MAIHSRYWYDELPDCRIERTAAGEVSGEDGKFVSSRCVYESLVERGRVLEGAFDITDADDILKLWQFCEDEHGVVDPEANVIHIRGRGWYALDRKQARQAEERLDERDGESDG